MAPGVTGGEYAAGLRISGGHKDNSCPEAGAQSEVLLPLVAQKARNPMNEV